MAHQILVLLTAAFLLVSGLAGAGHASTRVALVIGNSAYGHVPDLANPANDAADIAASLRRLDFDVTHLRNLSGQAMRRALRDFSRKAYGADMALIYFAGHGIEVNKQNYLVQVDAQLRSNLDIEYEAIPLDRVMSAVRGAKGLRLVLLDACRNNPFLAGIDIADGSRSIGRGLARVEPQVGTLVSYAAKGGTTAADGKGRNSPYTRALLTHLEQPGLEINFLFRKVRDSVIEQTSGRQEPFTYGSLPGKRLYLRAPQPPLTAGSDADRSLLQEQAAWTFVKRSRNLVTLRNCVAQFPNGRFRNKADAMISALEAEKEKSKVAAMKLPDEAPEPDDASNPIDMRQLTLDIQRELNRHGCNAGRPDGKWGRNSRRALQAFQENGKLRLASLNPTPTTLAALKRRKLQVCPVKCGPRHEAKNGKCVLKRCGRGQELNRRGLCVAKLDDQATKRKPKCSPRHRLKGDRCVLKSCGRGKELDRRGRCVATRQTRDRVQNAAARSSKKRKCGICRDGSGRTYRACSAGAYIKWHFGTHALKSKVKCNF